MKFIALMMTFTALNSHKTYHNFENKFKWRYFKISQIKEIVEDRVFNGSGGICEIVLDDNRVALVLEDCAHLMNRINGD